MLHPPSQPENDSPVIPTLTQLSLQSWGVDISPVGGGGGAPGGNGGPPYGGGGLFTGMGGERGGGYAGGGKVLDGGPLMQGLLNAAADLCTRSLKRLMLTLGETMKARLSTSGS